MTIGLLARWRCTACGEVSERTEVSLENGVGFSFSPPECDNCKFKHRSRPSTVPFGNRLAPRRFENPEQTLTIEFEPELIPDWDASEVTYGEHESEGE